MFKKLTALMTSVFLITGLCSCGKTVISPEENTGNSYKPVFSDVTQTVNLGYSKDDSLNPFFASGNLNSDLTSLVFEPLFYPDDSFKAQPGLGKSAEINGLTITVTLNSAVFSDGSALTSADAVYSFNKAKNSPVYKNELQNITSASAQGTDSVVFSLAKSMVNSSDALFFPIVKVSTAEDKASLPVGTGLYKYAGSGALTYNSICSRPEPTVKNIKLIEINKSSTLIHTLETGVIDAYFDDLSSGSYSQANSFNTRTNLPNLVFLGMNSSSYGLSSANVRQAVFYSVNRQSIVKNSFKNYAVQSYTPFHPEWHVFTDSDYDVSSFALDYSKSAKLIESAGFKGGMNLRLIVYAGNNFKVAAAREIKENLANIGINIEIKELSWEDYKLTLAKGEYDFYLGEMKLSTDMNLTPLFALGGAVYGINAADTTAKAYNEYAGGNISLKAFTDSFLQNMPIVPICFRMGSIVYSDRISPAADCDYMNAYKNIYEWTVAPAKTESETEK